MKFNLFSYEIKGELDNIDEEYIDNIFCEALIVPENVLGDLSIYINTVYKEILEYIELYTIKSQKGYLLGLPKRYKVLSIAMDNISNYALQLVHINLSIELKINRVTDIITNSNYDPYKKYYMTFAITNKYVDNELENILIKLGINTYTNNIEIISKYNELSDYEKLVINQLLIKDMRIVYSDTEDDMLRNIDQDLIQDIIDEDKNLN